jgi:H+/Cl- antiporter ClcA
MLAAAVTGGAVVFFTWLTEHALALFFAGQRQLGWAALDAQTNAPDRSLFVSLRLAVAKIGLTAWGALAGLSLGREGPSVQIGASLMHVARRWLSPRSAINEHGLLVAGGAAGIAAAFNTPLGGVIFAVEELSRRPEQRYSGLLIAAIMFSGLIAVSAYGNVSHFGVIHASALSLNLLGAGVVVALAGGLSGGLFSRLLIASVRGNGVDVLTRLRQRAPLLFAGLCGALVALIGVVSDGATFGSGYAHTRAILEAPTTESHDPLNALLKFMATWLTTWSGVPGGIFAPSLAIGADLGLEIAAALGIPADSIATLIALGMAAFLAAATQAPLTAFIIVMEMIDGHAMVLSLMGGVLIAGTVSKLISPPLYGSLATLQLGRIPKKENPPGREGTS